MSVPPSFRPARDEDLAAVEALLRAADLPAEGVRDHFPHGFVVAVADGRLIGAAGVEVHERHGLLRSVVVDPACGRAGVGTALVRNRLAWAADQRLLGVCLLTTTAAAFFERLGFTAAERRTAPGGIQQSSEFAAVCPASATYMALELVDAPA